MDNYITVTSRKSKSTALILCIFLGWVGAHQYYVGKIGKGFLYTCTGGLFFVGWFVDIFKILNGTFRDNVGMPLRKNGYSHRIQENNNYYIRPTSSRQIQPQVIDVSQNYDSMEGHDFEYYCAELLKKNGFENVEVTRGSGDQGIDILSVKDGVKYGIQCKCYSSDIGNKAVQEAFSGKTFYHCHVASVLTNRYFTASAKELAESNGVLLWDRDYLNKLIENAN